MDFTLQKTLTFVLFIGIGLLLKFKFQSREEISGIKKIILNLALPATIFIALLGIKIDIGLMVLPFMALALNVFLFVAFPYALPIAGIKRDTPDYRTAKLLIPSLAPGLSCFPFVLEFLGEDYLAKAAMADLGNKIFVLIILYVVAMNWHYRIRSTISKGNRSKIKSLVLAMISEPVNIFIIIALILVFFGLSMESLPFFISETLQRLRILMTPLVLLFIGLAVNIRRKQFLKLASMLFLRAGTVLFICGICIYLGRITVQNEILLMLAFGLSACSFWPYAHIAAVDAQEMDVPNNMKTFNGNFAINTLALSFPLSTILILGVLSSGSLFYGAMPIFIASSIFILIGFLPVLATKILQIRSRSEKRKAAWLRYRTAATTERA